MIFIKLKYWVVKFIEKIPLLQIYVYNHLDSFKFLFPHDKDYLALKLLFKNSEKRDFIDVGGNIGLSTIGFRELGFKKNRILLFEPDFFLINKFLKKLKKNYKKLKFYKFGLSDNNEKKLLYKAFYKGEYFHFNNSFDKNYILKKIQSNYPDIYKKFKLKKTYLTLKRFDNLRLKTNACFVKIDVEGYDHKVLYGMRNLIKLNKPTLLIEYNESNFKDIYKVLKLNYYCYKYNVDKNHLVRLLGNDIKKLLKGKSLEKKYSKNSVNIFYIHKKKKI